MLEYPENHGVGAPTTRAQAHIYYHLGLAYEKLGKYQLAIKAWHEAASEHHPHGKELFGMSRWRLIRSAVIVSLAWKNDQSINRYQTETKVLRMW